MAVLSFQEIIAFRWAQAHTQEHGVRQD